MYVFNYHPDTGAYLGGSTADYDQLEPGRVLVPAWATEVPPPRWTSGKNWPFFVPATGTWELRSLAPAATQRAEEGTA